MPLSQRIFYFDGAKITWWVHKSSASCNSDDCPAPYVHYGFYEFDNFVQNFEKKPSETLG